MQKCGHRLSADNPQSARSPPQPVAEVLCHQHVPLYGGGQIPLAVQASHEALYMLPDRIFQNPCERTRPTNVLFQHSDLLLFK